MKRKVVWTVLAVVVLFALMAVTLLAGDKTDAASQNSGKTSSCCGDQSASVEPNQQTCPVMGGEVDKTVFSDYNGNRVYFCCESCKARFNESPEKYLKTMSENGVVLEKAPCNNCKQVKSADKSE